MLYKNSIYLVQYPFWSTNIMEVNNTSMTNIQVTNNTIYIEYEYSRNMVDIILINYYYLFIIYLYILLFIIGPGYYYRPYIFMNYFSRTLCYLLNLCQQQIKTSFYACYARQLKTGVAINCKLSDPFQLWFLLLKLSHYQ